MLHGAGGDAEGALNILQKVAEPLEMIVLAVEPRSSTWDILMGREGPDIAFIDRALAETFNRYAIDPSKVAIAVSPTVLPTPYPFVLPMATCLLMWLPFPPALWHLEPKWAEPGYSFLTVKRTTFCQSIAAAV